MKPGCLAALLLLSCTMFFVPASADVYTGEVHTTVTVSGTYFWSGIEVGDGQTVEYTVKVESGDAVNVGLMDDSKLALFLLGSSVTTIHTNEDTTSTTYSYSTAGKYALVVDNGYGTSVCKVDIVVRSANFWETGTGCIVIIVVILIIGIVVVALVVMRVRKRRPAAPPATMGRLGAEDLGQSYRSSAPSPQQFGTPAPQYGAPAYPAQQYHSQAPPQYPAPAQQYPAAPQPAYEATAPAGNAMPPQPGYPAQPVPPQTVAPTAQPPATAAAPGPTALCKYCDFQMPAGTQICPRCGGFN